MKRQNEDVTGSLLDVTNEAANSRVILEAAQEEPRFVGNIKDYVFFIRMQKTGHHDVT